MISKHDIRKDILERLKNDSHLMTEVGKKSTLRAVEMKPIPVKTRTNRSHECENMRAAFLQ